eukprot:COSAG02_NODE_4514_length_5276_cov_1.972571_2_plen_180_part_00
MRAAAALLALAVGNRRCGAVPTVPPEPAPHAAGPFAALMREPWESERRAAQDAHGCDAIMASIGEDLNEACCADPKSRCGAAGVPHSCARDCATLWMPFQKECSLWLLAQFPNWCVCRPQNTSQYTIHNTQYTIHAPSTHLRDASVWRRRLACGQALGLARGHGCQHRTRSLSCVDAQG